jgi:hypothetical protein
MLYNRKYEKMPLLGFFMFLDSSNLRCARIFCIAKFLSALRKARWPSHGASKRKKVRARLKKYKMSPINSARRALQDEYHIMGFPVANWLTCSAFTHRARVRSRTHKSFFILLSKFMKIFSYPHFMRGTRKHYYFSMKTFGKIEKFQKRDFSKSFHGKIIAPPCSSHKM